MKKLLAALVLFAAVTGISFAQTLPASLTMDELMRMPANTIGVQTPNELAKWKKQAMNQLLEQNDLYRVDSGINPYYNFGASESNPVVYEPKSGVLLAVFRGVFMHEGGTAEDPSDGVIYLRTSSDNGKTWSQGKTLYRQQQAYPIDPSIVVLNPTGSSNPDDFEYVVFAALYKKDPNSEEIPLFGGLYIIYQNGELTPNEVATPEFGNQEKAHWYTSNMIANQTANGHYFYNWGILVPEKGKNTGNYGFAAYEMTNGSFYSSIPSTWGIDNFRKQTDQTETYYQNGMEVRADQNGMLYAAVANMFPKASYPFDEDTRILAISKSSDNGTSWSAWDKTDTNLYYNFAKDVMTQAGGELKGWFILPYKGDAFEVTGVDEYSYITRIAVLSTNTDLFRDHVILVEISRKNGTWTLTPISELTLSNLLTIRSETIDQNGTETADFIETNDMGNEVESALSENGSQIIVKWVDYVEGYQKFDPAKTFYQRNTATADRWDYTTANVDSLLSTDVFIAWRDVNGGQWDVKQISHDPTYEKITRMPPVVPNKDEIILFSVETDEETAQFTDPTNSLFGRRGDYEPLLKQMITDASQNVEVVTFDYDNGYNRVISVVESAPGFSVEAPYPNPVSTEKANIRFNLVNAGNVTFRMTNSIGEVIAERTEFVGAGAHDIPVPVAMLSNGSYFYTITVGDHTISQILNVIR